MLRFLQFLDDFADGILRVVEHHTHLIPCKAQVDIPVMAQDAGNFHPAHSYTLTAPRSTSSRRYIFPLTSFFMWFT